MLPQMAKQIDELRGQFNKSILMSNDTDEKYKPPKRVSLPSGTPPVVPSPRTAALADSMSGGGPPMPRARSSNLQGSSSSPLVPYSSPRYSRDSSDGERNSANSPLSFGNLNLRSPKKFS